MVKKADYRIETYNKNKKREWDRFVREQSVNGTLFHTRSFLSYHPKERFSDRSIILHHDDHPVCVFPACVEDGAIFSHSGSSYGGPIVAREYYRIKKLVPLLHKIYAYYNEEVGMRIAPSIMGCFRNDPILYIYSRMLNIRCELGVYKDLRNENLIESIPRQSNRSAIRRNLKNETLVRTPRNPAEVNQFYQILESNLQKHNEQPTHTLDEFINLREILQDDQLLLLSFNENNTLNGGTWIFKASRQTWHTFYIAKDYSHGDYATTPFLLYHAMKRAKEGGIKFLNFGICTQDQGKKMNQGLFDFKESLGGETINRYILE